MLNLDTDTTARSANKNPKCNEETSEREMKEREREGVIVALFFIYLSRKYNYVALGTAAFRARFAVHHYREILQMHLRTRSHSWTLALPRRRARARTRRPGPAIVCGLMLVLVRVVRHPPDEVEPRRVIRVAKGRVGKRADGRTNGRTDGRTDGTLVKGGAGRSQGRTDRYSARPLLRKEKRTRTRHARGVIPSRCTFLLFAWSKL